MSRRLLSHTNEDYLKHLYLLGQGGRVSTQALADALAVSPASTTGMLRKLSDLGLVTHAAYQGATLTEEGQRVALEILRHHRLLELYLHRALGYPLDEVHDEAERLEHVISEAFEERIASWLGHPTLDPHGDPIPDKNGALPDVTTHSLSSLAVGQDARITRVPGDTPLLRALMDRGLTPDTEVRLDSRDDALGLLIVSAGGRQHPLSIAVADRVHVTPAREVADA